MAMAGTPKILFVEDQVLLKFPMEEALSARGFTCLYAGTLDSALEILRAEKLAAAILDPDDAENLVPEVGATGETAGHIKAAGAMRDDHGVTQVSPMPSHAAGEDTERAAL